MSIFFFPYPSMTDEEYRAYLEKNKRAVSPLSYLVRLAVPTLAFFAGVIIAVFTPYKIRGILLLFIAWQIIKRAVRRYKPAIPDTKGLSASR